MKLLDILFILIGILWIEINFNYLLLLVKSITRVTVGKVMNAKKTTIYL